MYEEMSIPKNVQEFLDEMQSMESKSFDEKLEFYSENLDSFLHGNLRGFARCLFSDLEKMPATKQRRVFEATLTNLSLLTITHLGAVMKLTDAEVEQVATFAVQATREKAIELKLDRLGKNG